MAHYIYALMRYHFTPEHTAVEQVGGTFMSNKDAKQAMLADLRATLPDHAQREEFDFGFVADDGMLVINTQNASYWMGDEQIAWQITYYKPLPFPHHKVGDIVGVAGTPQTEEEIAFAKQYAKWCTHAVPATIVKMKLWTGNSPWISYLTVRNSNGETATKAIFNLFNGVEQ